MIVLRMPTEGSRAGGLLGRLLVERGLEVYAPAAPQGQIPDAVVCYGAGYSGIVPCINGAAGRDDKLEHLRAMKDAGVPVPKFAETLDTISRAPYGTSPMPPCLARSRHHHGGRDIMMVWDYRDAERRRAAGADFFVEYVRHDREFRVWSYRGRTLGVYEKILKYPEMYKHIGASRRNGFAFEIRTSDALPDPGITVSAHAAVRSLGLDFGAVDLLYSSNKHPEDSICVLEVNTAPGVDGPRQGISKLADKIKHWVELGYPSRRGAGHEAQE